MLPLHEHLSRIRGPLTAWWHGEDQEYPCLLLTQSIPGGTPPATTDDLHRQWFDPPYVVGHAMFSLEHTRYLGVAAPVHCPSLGSAAMAGVLGAKMDYVDTRTIWPRPSGRPLAEMLDIKLDPANAFYGPLLEMTRQSAALSRDHHWVAPFPLEGPGDCLEGVYGAFGMFTAMVDQPALVEAAMQHFTGLWLQAFDELGQIIEGAGNPGSVGWAGIWAPGRTFPLQEDFSYNISPAMFRRFVLPFLREIVAAVPYPMFHLDGTLAHLPALLEIPGLRAIQWVPGPGQETIARWYELIETILAHGKSVEVFCSPDEVDDLVARVGARGLLIGLSDCTPAQADRLFARYGGLG